MLESIDFKEQQTYFPRSFFYVHLGHCRGKISVTEGSNYEVLLDRSVINYIAR